jgi:insertion element IS1 protein InsB
MMACRYCNYSCIKYGKQKNGQQRYKCKKCGRAQQGNYSKMAYGNIRLNNWVGGMVKEGCGIRSMARLLGISVNTIIKRIKKIASCVIKAPVIKNQEAVEVDELRTFVGNKQNEY